MNRTLPQLLDQRISALPQRKTYTASVYAVLFPSHQLVVNFPGHSRVVADVGNEVDFGTQTAQLVTRGMNVKVTLDDITGHWIASSPSTSNVCIPTTPANMPNVPLPVYQPPIPYFPPPIFPPSLPPIPPIILPPWLPPSSLPSTADEEVYSIPGTLSVANGSLRLYNRSSSAWTLLLVYISVGTAPTGASLIVDVNKNGVTIFTTQANRPSIAASANTGVSGIPDIKTINVGDYLTVDVDAVGSTVAGADLTVQFPVAR